MLPESEVRKALQEAPQTFTQRQRDMKRPLLSGDSVGDLDYGSEALRPEIDRRPSSLGTQGHDVNGMPSNSSTLPLMRYQEARAQQSCAERAWNGLCAVGRFFKNTVAPVVRSTIISTASTIGALSATDGMLKLTGHEGIYDDDPTALLTALTVGVIGSIGYGLYNHGYYGQEPEHAARPEDQHRYPGKTVTLAEMAFVLGEINIAMAEIVQMASENAWFQKKVKEDPSWLAAPILAGIVLGGGLAATYLATTIGSMAYPRMTANERGEYQGKLYQWVTDPAHPERASRFASLLATMFGASVHGYPTLQGLQNMGVPAPAAIGFALLSHLAG